METVRLQGAFQEAREGFLCVGWHEHGIGCQAYITKTPGMGYETTVSPFRKGILDILETGNIKCLKLEAIFFMIRVCCHLQLSCHHC